MSNIDWNGEGLPPVGAFVEVVDDGSLRYGSGESGEVIAHVENTAVVRMSYGLGCFEAKVLRPVKTPEQNMKPTLPEYATEAGITLTKRDGLWWAKDSTGVTIWATSVDNLTDERLKGLNDACFAYFMGTIEGRRTERERRWEQKA